MSLNSLPPDLRRLTLSLLDDVDLTNILPIKNRLLQSSLDRTFWLNKIVNKYGLTYDQIEKYRKKNTHAAYYNKLNQDTTNKTPWNILFLGSNIGREDLVRIGLKRGADPHAENDQALINSSSHGHIEIVRLLLAAGADPHAQYDYALRLASQNGHTEIVRLLLENGADPHALNDAALRDASANGHTEVVRLLLENGADPHADNDEALRYARYNGHTEVLELLREYS